MRTGMRTATAAAALFTALFAGQLSAQVAGTRELPDFYTPGATLNVIISVDVGAYIPAGLIVSEAPPSGWTVVSATPAYNTVVGGEYKWVFYGGDVADRTITYTVAVPSTSSGAQAFAGQVKYNNAGGTGVENDIAGDTTILTNTPARLQVSPGSLTFTPGTTFQTFTVANLGGANLTWNAASTQAWLTLTRTSGVLGPGESEVVTANVNPTGLAAGTHAASIDFTSNGGNSSVPVALIISTPSPVTDFVVYPAVGGIQMYWTNPAAFTGTVIFRKANGAMASGPIDGKTYDVGDSEGDALCVFKDTAAGATSFFDDSTAGTSTYFYKIHAFADVSYSAGLTDSTRPITSLYTGTLNDFTVSNTILVGGTGTPLDKFLLLFPAFSLTGTPPAQVDLAMIAEGAAPPHPGFVGFANIYAVTSLNTVLGAGQSAIVHIPVYQDDLAAAGVLYLSQVYAYHWPGPGRTWESLPIRTRVEVKIGNYVGYVEVFVEHYSSNDYFAIGAPVLVSGGGGGCFIATAAYGTPMARDIDALRAFRDQRLLKSRSGAAFVRFYYRHSPPVADYIRTRPVLRAMVRGGLKPLVWASTLMTGR